METPAPQEVQYGAIISRLIENFEPARRIWPVNIRLGLWLALEVCILALVTLLAPRADLLSALRNPSYVLEVGLFVVAGMASGAFALRTAIPGLEATTAQVVPVLMAAFIAIIVAALAPAQTEITLGTFIGVGMKCFVCTGLFAAPPWLALFWAVKRAAPLSGELAGALVGTAAFSFAFAATRLGCPIDDSLHVLTWHIMPAGVGIAISTLAGVVWLGRKTPYRAGPQAKSNYI
jgi:hypothetical protein